MKLLELLNTDVPAEVVTEDAEKYEEVAYIHGRKIVFQAQLTSEEEWEIAFVQEVSSFGSLGYSINLTKAGGEMKVFAFVRAALDRFIRHYDPRVFQFSAETREPSRVKLYTALVKRFHTSEYEVTTHTAHGARYWTFKR